MDVRQSSRMNWCELRDHHMEFAGMVTREVADVVSYSYKLINAVQESIDDLLEITTSP
ncbi:hypothetical protein LCGC14_3108320, partial [marine sediment metagenome]